MELFFSTSSYYSFNAFIDLSSQGSWLDLNSIRKGTARESAHAIKQYVYNKIIHRTLTRLPSLNLRIGSSLHHNHLLNCVKSNWAIVFCLALLPQTPEKSVERLNWIDNGKARDQLSLKFSSEEGKKMTRSNIPSNSSVLIWFLAVLTNFFRVHQKSIK